MPCPGASYDLTDEGGIYVQRKDERLILHTELHHEEENEKTEQKRVRWRVLPHPQNAARKREPAAARGKTPRLRVRRTTGEKLLRNTAIACVLLLSVMAVSRIDQPWANRAVETVSNAVNMTLHLDDTLGKLNFVKRLMPDAALVFWNMGTKDALARPVSGVLTHAYDPAQPWLLYQVNEEQPVYAAASGTIAAVTENEQGEWTMLIDHEAGEQTVYAYLNKVIVKTGQTVERGTQIGVTAQETAGRMYFELRQNGTPVDPTARISGG